MILIMNRAAIFFLIITLLPFKHVLSQSLFGDRVTDKPEWNALFIHQEGWFGGDGIFAIPLDGKEFIPATVNTRSLFVFGDTMIGTIEDGTLKPGDFSMIHNSVGILKGKEPNLENIEFYWTEDEDNPHAVFDPQTPLTEDGDYYWLGDGFVNIDHDGTLYIFGYRIRNVEGAIFGFKQVGVSLIAIPKGSEPPYSNNQQYDTPFFIEKGGEQTSFGSAVYVNTESAGAPNPDGYIYVYGVRGAAKELVVARVLSEYFSEFEKWEFWAGFSWEKDIGSLHAIASNVSNEMSLSPISDGRIIMVYQHKTISPDVAIQVGNSPVGPFFPVKKIWNTPEVYEDMDFFTYNAKAYPHLSEEGYLLISYNINSFDFWKDILDKPNLYRPRFIRLKLD